MAAPTPRPADWKGGSEDFSILRTLDGHIATDRFATDEGDMDDHRNERTGFAQADLSGDDYGLR